MVYSRSVFGFKPVIFLILSLMISSCNGNKKVYKSSCDDDRVFKHISLAHLIDSINYYDKQFVEVTGEYQQDKGRSVLFGTPHTEGKALWMDFSPNCPLYLSGTRTGFFDFDYNGGKLTPVSSGTITIRGEINSHNKGRPAIYKGTIAHISYIKF